MDWKFVDAPDHGFNLLCVHLLKPAWAIIQVLHGFLLKVFTDYCVCLGQLFKYEYCVKQNHYYR